MLDAAPEAIVVVGRQGSVVALNREAELLFGWSDAELVGEPSSRLITPGFQKAYDALGANDGDSPHFSYTRRAPRLGEHTDEVLTSADLSDDAIATLRKSNLV